MEQTALRPKPMPGRERAQGTAPGPARRTHGGRRRRRRLTTVLSGLFVGTVLVLTGVGLGTVGAGVIGMSKLAELRHQTQEPGAGKPPAALAAPSGAPPAPPSPAPARATLGVEAVDDERPGALVVGIHVPGPGHSAGLVRGDVLLAFGSARVDSAADLARAVARARPGERVELTVRHESGGYQQLTVVPGVVT
ncbi:PDZ domain-containing protein [Streptomyces poriticola]|uniref:PDZ domain-containing protein n=1 Tax=Streptomyces poriticola TaxID=3120506 RepID=UPI002FCDE3EB